MYEIPPIRVLPNSSIEKVPLSKREQGQDQDKEKSVSLIHIHINPGDGRPRLPLLKSNRIASHRTSEERKISFLQPGRK